MDKEKLIKEEIAEIRIELKTINLRMKKIWEIIEDDRIERDVIRGKLHELVDIKNKVNELWLMR